MEQERKYFIFYRSFFDALEQADMDTQLIMYRAIARYALDRIEPTFDDGMAKILWSLIRPQLEANWKRFDNGCKGGAPMGNTNNRYSKKDGDTTEVQPNNNQDTTEVQPNNIKNNRIKNNRIIEEINKEDTIIGVRAKRTAFAPPTQEDVECYVSEKGYKVDAGRFIDFYSSKGWMIGKNKMKDWRAAVRTWNRKEQQNYEDNRTNNRASREERLQESAVLMQSYLNGIDE